MPAQRLGNQLQDRIAHRMPFALAKKYSL